MAFMWPSGELGSAGSSGDVSKLIIHAGRSSSLRLGSGLDPESSEGGSPHRSAGRGHRTECAEGGWGAFWDPAACRRCRLHRPPPDDPRRLRLNLCSPLLPCRPFIIGVAGGTASGEQHAGPGRAAAARRT